MGSEDQYKKALEILERDGYVNYSSLQRGLRVSFNGASMIIERMVEEGLLYEYNKKQHYYPKRTSLVKEKKP